MRWRKWITAKIQRGSSEVFGWDRREEGSSLAQVEVLQSLLNGIASVKGSWTPLDRPMRSSSVVFVSEAVKLWTSSCKRHCEGRTRFFRKKTEEVKTCERHMFILEFKEIYTVKEICEVLRISELGYYRWLKNRNKLSKQQLLLGEINAILVEHGTMTTMEYAGCTLRLGNTVCRWIVAQYTEL